MSLKDFGKTATKLTHNPLGIIALAFEQFRRRLLERVSSLNVPLEWRFYDFNELKRLFGVAEEPA